MAVCCGSPSLNTRRYLRSVWTCWGERRVTHSRVRTGADARPVGRGPRGVSGGWTGAARPRGRRPQRAAAWEGERQSARAQVHTARGGRARGCVQRQHRGRAEHTRAVLVGRLRQGRQAASAARAGRASPPSSARSSSLSALRSSMGSTGGASGAAVASSPFMAAGRGACDQGEKKGSVSHTCAPACADPAGQTKRDGGTRAANRKRGEQRSMEDECSARTCQNSAPLFATWCCDHCAARGWVARHGGALVCVSTRLAGACGPRPTWRLISLHSPPVPASRGALRPLCEASWA